MAGSQIERVFSVLERLTADPRGLPLQTLAEQLEIPKSATHRLLAELIRLGYVRQNPDNLRYQLSTRLVAMGFRYLSASGADIVQPVLDRLAVESGELVRLGVIEGERQTWIAKSQGARSGLRYDPDMGREAPLFYTASGHAWLATLSDAEALSLVERQAAEPRRTWGQRSALEHRTAGAPAPGPGAGLCLGRRKLRRGHLGDRRGGAPSH
ncbi:hypothetical protein PBOI14_67730 [Pseudomonas sp. Boi14]|nr:hypothetical protein PBOI14_67730 [Pseudomonas sp. Boi14]